MARDAEKRGVWTHYDMLSAMESGGRGWDCSSVVRIAVIKDFKEAWKLKNELWHANVTVANRRGSPNQICKGRRPVCNAGAIS